MRSHFVFCVVFNSSSSVNAEQSVKCCYMYLSQWCFDDETCLDSLDGSMGSTASKFGPYGDTVTSRKSYAGLQKSASAHSSRLYYADKYI